MSGATVQCPTCGKVITVEEIEIGTSLVCRACDPASAEPEGEPQHGSEEPREAD